MAVQATQRPRRSGPPNQNRGINDQATGVAPDLADLPSLSHAELKHQWAGAFGTAPPMGLSRRLMIYALAYDLQAQQMGQLKPSVRRDLREFAAPETSQSSITISAKITPGTRLMREWRGTVHVVDVTEEGLMWNGRVYNSLSAIARTITGTRWSGQRFFGLRKRSDAVGKSRTGRAEVSDHEATQATGSQPNEGRCSDELDSSLRPTDTGIKSDAFQPPESISAESAASRHPDIVDTEHTASLADASKHAPSQACSKLEPEPVS